MAWRVSIQFLFIFIICPLVTSLTYDLPAENHPHKTTTVGQAVTIPCHSSNSNPVNWWYQRRDDKPVTELVVNGELVNGNSERFRLSTSNYNLTLLSAKWTDRGIYTCVEDTAYGTRHITRLVVKALVINKTATVGCNVTLVCNSSVARSVNWWFKDHLATDETEIVVNGEVVNGNEVRMTLVGYDLFIQNAFRNDSGTYTCVEDTGFGQQHKTLLTVSDALKRQESLDELSTGVLWTTTSHVNEAISERTMHCVSSTSIGVAVAIVAVIIALIVVAIFIYKKMHQCLRRANNRRDDGELQQLMGDSTGCDGFWRQTLPTKLERASGATKVKVTQRCGAIDELTKQPELRERWISPIVEYIRDKYNNNGSVDAIVGHDARGCLFAFAVAMRLQLPYIRIHVQETCEVLADPENLIKTTYKNRENTKDVKVQIPGSHHPGVTTVIFVYDEFTTGRGTKAAVEMLSQIGVKVLESIVIHEFCEFSGRENLADTDVIITSLVKTESDDEIPGRHFFCC